MLSTDYKRTCHASILMNSSPKQFMNTSPNKNYMGFPSTSMLTANFSKPVPSPTLTCNLNLLFPNSRGLFSGPTMSNIWISGRISRYQTPKKFAQYTPRQWQSIPLLPACDWKTKSPEGEASGVLP